MTRPRELAKFFSGFETFHALMHAYLWASGTEPTVFGIHLISSWNGLGGLVHGVVALVLGLWAWRARPSP